MSASASFKKDYFIGQRKRRRERAQQRVLRASTFAVRAALEAGHPNLTSVVAKENASNANNNMTLFGGLDSQPGNFRN